jgi:hypothetical protein
VSMKKVMEVNWCEARTWKCMSKVWLSCDISCFTCASQALITSHCRHHQIDHNKSQFF